jgi:hypothetical protein
MTLKVGFGRIRGSIELCPSPLDRTISPVFYFHQFPAVVSAILPRKSVYTAYIYVGGGFTRNFKKSFIYSLITINTLHEGNISTSNHRVIFNESLFSKHN